MKTYLIFMIVNLFLFSGLFSLFAKEIKKDFHRSFEVKEGTTLKLKHGDGDVTITPWEKDELDVEVHYRADINGIGLWGDMDFDVDFRQRDDTIYIIGREGTNGKIVIGSKKEYQYIYTIRAPHYLNLELEGDDGNVSVRDWIGEIDFTVDDGEVRLRRVENSFTFIRTADGDISIDSLTSGKLSLMSDDGNIDLRNCRTKKCKIDLSDGDVTIENSAGNFRITTDDGSVYGKALAAGELIVKTDDGRVEMEMLKSGYPDVDLRTYDGNITLHLPPDLPAAFSLRTEGGNLRMKLPGLKNLEQGEHWMTGETVGGEGSIRIRTDDGNITVKEIK